MADPKLPRGAGPGTDNSLDARGVVSKIRRAISPPRDINLPDPAKRNAVRSMRSILTGGGAPSPSKR